jgi:uncharacterized protein YbdZ (MbtH family)
VHGHLGLTTLCDPQGLGSLVGLVLGHAVQGHRVCKATRLVAWNDALVSPQTVRHTHCSECEGCADRYPHAVTMMCGGVGSETTGTQVDPAERPLDVPHLAPYLLQRYRLWSYHTPQPTCWNVLGDLTHKRRCGEYAIALPAGWRSLGRKLQACRAMGQIRCGQLPDIGAAAWSLGQPLQCTTECGPDGGYQTGRQPLRVQGGSVGSVSRCAHSI